MAGRSVKQGLVFFPFDCDLFKDRKLRLLERMHPRIGTLAYLRILCEIYRDKGYYVPADDVLYDEIETSLKLELGEGVEIVASCVKCGLFNKHIYESYGVLTSAGIQRRYNDAVRNSRRRGYITSESEYALINASNSESSVLNETTSESRTNGETGYKSPEKIGRAENEMALNSEAMAISSEEIKTFPSITSISSEEMYASRGTNIISDRKPAHNGTEHNITENYNTHTVLDRMEGGVGETISVSAAGGTELETARGLLAWIAVSVPTVGGMDEPFTEQHLVWILRKYTVKDIRRIILDMHNKRAFENVSAYATFINFAKYDNELAERKNAKSSGLKSYTYDEVCDLVTSHRHKMSDFEVKEIDGVRCWFRKIDAIRAKAAEIRA